MTRAPLPATSTRGSVRALGAVSVSFLSIPLGLSLAGGSASAALVASVPPPPTKSLPTELDIAPKYQEGYRCLSGDLPGPTAFAQLLNGHYGRHAFGINRTCAAEHGEGRALDWMVNAYSGDGLALGNAITRWLSAADSQGRPGAMARRFGINYIIWNRQMWRAYDPGRGWAPYSGVSPHTDHIHISFTWDGAYQRTSWWTGKALTSVQLTGPTTTGPTAPVVTTPAVTASGYPHLKRGDTHKDLLIAQGALAIAKDGQFGPGTEAAVASWQSRQGLTVTKQLDNATWTKLVQRGLVPSRTGTTTPSPLSAYVNTVIQRGSTGAAVVALQKALGITADGSFGPGTETKVKAYQTSKRISPTGIVASSTWKALMGTTTTTPTTPTSPLSAYAKLVLKRGSTGPAVVALQKALAIGADGSFGPGTETRVIAYQKTKGISPTGVVAATTWAALMGQSTTTPPTTATPSATSTAFTAYKSTVLRTGSKGTAVKVLQVGLGGIAVDGAFGQATASRVIAFQRSAGLKATGVVDTATWNRIELMRHPLFPYWNTVAKRGSTGANVIALQRALRIGADGVFGPGTEAAVKAAQARAKVASTGVVATLTWRAIEKQM